ncbi:MULTISPECIES: ABC transporter substrate-binding protein [Brucella]|uniref:Maltose-binding periplasmic protein n=1 Tax=Brucella melitensis biotype 1 (strain ATCC 23456 / CCUG 17765 / NCTC 10094 / 16M) TaxID=224914 RepID=Q8YBF5_BRUME|nr:MULTISPECIES: ABC transporter substrate-binding protein [Brucella]EPZ76445.1 ABC transporter substrate-binding protein [Brucella melitensis ADMAS-G1]AAL54187.1 maltose-binding periplasmic protein [Brucella melitensis bv. 1 str. 16M]AIJ87550.1 bacterial extracellular solute-binding family protein [Brucella melitensis bv. 3 str. Ether]AIJ88568.1 bacterial extracellular solute-binding family protein [Brucella melitensis bv. 1 str. 16M]AOG51116.1 ABC transporter substrate-binding protein [Bruce
MRVLTGALVACAAFGFATGWAQAVEISIAANSTGDNIKFLQEQVAKFEKDTGNKVNIISMPSSSSEQFSQYRLWLAAGNSDVDVYQTDIVWAPQLSDQFIDLTEATKDVTDAHFPSIIASQTVNGKLVALPFYTDAPALFCRKDLLEKYNKPVPKTWDEMAATAKDIMEKERADGKADLWGFVFQGNAYEGLTCNALEWIKSSGGGQIVEPDGEISVNNEKAAAAIDRARGWIGTISPQGVLGYQEEESRGVWQTGNAVFMRNWPYVYALSNSADSAVKGKFDVAPLPAMAEGEPPASALGGWNLAVSKYSTKQDAAIALVKFLASPEVQKAEAVELSRLPTIEALYDDKDVIAAQPFMANWKPIFQNAVPRPSAATKVKYNEVSSKFWTAVHKTLAGSGTAAENLELLEVELTELKGSGW